MSATKMPKQKGKAAGHRELTSEILINIEGNGIEVLKPLFNNIGEGENTL